MDQPQRLTCVACKKQPPAVEVPSEALGPGPRQLFSLCWYCAHMVCHHDETVPLTNLNVSCDCPRDEIYPDGAA